MAAKVRHRKREGNGPNQIQLRLTLNKKLNLLPPIVPTKPEKQIINVSKVEFIEEYEDSVVVHFVSGTKRTFRFVQDIYNKSQFINDLKSYDRHCTYEVRLNGDDAEVSDDD